MSAAALVWFYLFVGSVYLVTQSSIGIFVRAPIAKRSTLLRALLYCPACVGAWTNLVLALTGYWPLSSAFPWWLLPFGALIAGAGCGFIWGGVQDALLGEHGRAWEIEKELYAEEESAGPSGG